MFRREKLEVYTTIPGQLLLMANTSVTDFKALVPFDHAAEPDNQKTANIVVNMKSY